MKLISILSMNLAMTLIAAQAAAQAPNWESSKKSFDSASMPIGREFFSNQDGKHLEGSCFKFDDKEKAIHAEYANIVLGRNPLRVRPALLVGPGGYIGLRTDFTQNHSLVFTAESIDVELRQIDSSQFAALIEGGGPNIINDPPKCNSIACTSGNTYCSFSVVP